MSNSTLASNSPQSDVMQLEHEAKVYVAPPSFSQQRLWLMDQLNPASPVYALPAVFRLKGNLNILALERALNEILRRHEILRTTFGFVNGELAQIIAPSMRLELAPGDVHAMPETQREAYVSKLINKEIRRPFNLGEGPLIRASLLRVEAADHVLILNVHHMVADAWSFGILAKQLTALYAAYVENKPSPLAPLTLQFADFSIWEKSYMQGERLQTQLSYWQEQLGGNLPILELPADRPRPPRQTFNGALMPIELSPSLTDGLKALSRRQQASPFMTLLAAFKVLLHRYTGQSNLLVAAPVANRSHEDLESLIGFFVNLVVFRTDVSDDPSFSEYLNRVREVTSSAYAHKEVPFEKLVQELRPERDLSHNPLVQIMFAFHFAPIGLELAGLECELLPVDNGAAKFDLYLESWETDGCIRGRIEYNTDLFDSDRIARMASHFKTLLAGIVANPEQRLSELPLLPDAERRQVLIEWNKTERLFPQDCGIHDLFEAQVERSPEATALICGRERLSYMQLKIQAERLAGYLRLAGVGPETLVGVCLDRSPALMATLLAVLKVGAAYVPLDPAYPKERIKYILNDACAPWLVTQRKFAELFKSVEARAIFIDDQTNAEFDSRTQVLNAGAYEATGHMSQGLGSAARELAYVLYTSGSTGRPKGVAIEHRSVVNLIYWAKEIFTTQELAGVLAGTSMCFDLSVFEMFVPLSWGGTVILAENALQLPQLPAARQVTMVNTVPSAITELLRMKGLPQSVRVVNLAGEPLAPQLVDQLYAQGASIVKVYDLYGPTEDSVYSTVALRRRHGPAIIGRPLANKRVYILDQNRHPVPVGVPGELFIGGAGLAREYLHQPDLTAEKFIKDPFQPEDPSSRLYRTGDLARYSSDGNIEFLGRTDRQVKLRGFRIELGEIESVMTQHPAISDLVVVVQGETPDDQQLVAYMVLKEGQAPTASELHQFASVELPPYMVPSAFMALKAMPLTPNGKVDRAALACSESMRLDPGSVFAAPLSVTQKRLTEIWSEALGLEQIGIHDNFFDLGGHSLTAMRVANRLSQEFGDDFSMTVLFESPTIAELAETIENRERKGTIRINGGELILALGAAACF